MEKKNQEIINIANFEGNKIRRHYDEATETWYFSVIDIVAALTEQNDFQLARNYWKVLKIRLKSEGSETVTKCNRLKIETKEFSIFNQFSIKNFQTW